VRYNKTRTHLTVKEVYKYIQALSLDVAFGSTVMSAFVAHFLNVHVSLSIYVSLFIAVWLIYTIDHLIDANRIKEEAQTFRHKFHQKYFKQLTSAWIVFFLGGVVFSVLVLPNETIKVGFIASALVIVHLVLVYLLGSRVSIFIQKELGVAFTYCVGIIVGPLSMSTGLDGFGYLLMFQIFILALLNLLEFSWYDRTHDAKHGQTSAVRGLGEKVVLEVVFFLFTVFILTLVVSFLFFPQYAQYEFILCLMGGTLFIVFVFQKFFKKQERYRVFGDMVFLFPLLILLQL